MLIREYAHSLAVLLYAEEAMLAACDESRSNPTIDNGLTVLVFKYKPATWLVMLLPLRLYCVLFQSIVYYALAVNLHK